MKDYLEAIIRNNEFYPVNEESNIYSNQLKAEYFIVENYSKEDFLNFFESDTTETIIEEFTNSQQSPEFENLKKNTSLFLLVKVEDLKEAYEKLKSHLILIEEDAYYFRKFVILYTENALFGLQKNIDLSQLYDLLEEKILDFEDNMFFDESYFLAMEIAIKLPFFKIKDTKEEYKTIEEEFKDDNDSIDNQLLGIFEKQQNYISLLSDIEEGKKLASELADIFDKELEN